MKKLILLMLLVLAMGVILAACNRGNGGTAATPAPPATPTPAAPTPAETPAPAEEEPAPTYPLPGNRTVTWWEALGGATAANFVNQGDTPFAQELQAQTGVTIDFIHPPAGQATEQFNIMMASRNFHDIMVNNWFTAVPGGPERAIEDQVILRLNDVFDSYAPYLSNFIHNERPDIGNMIRSDEGSYFIFPFIRADSVLQTHQGAFFRADWLEELNLPIPETVQDWEDTLIAFRDYMGATAPWGYQLGAFRNIDPIALAHGIRLGWFLNSDGDVRFGWTKPEYMDYLEVMRRWWDEGLLDPDFATSNQEHIAARVTDHSMGAAFGQGGSRMGVMLSAMLDHPTFDLVGVPYPVLNRGDRPMHGQFDHAVPGTAAAITTSARDVEAAARLLDFGYSPAGHMLHNFGIEGRSFEMVNGDPILTDIMVNHPSLPLDQAFSYYVRSHMSGNFVQDPRYLMQFWQMPQQRAALPVWADTDAVYHTLPPVIFTPDEAGRVAALTGNINTFVQEMHLRFIFGYESLDNFDSYVEQVYAMGLAELRDIQQAAVDRFRAR